MKEKIREKVLSYGADVCGFASIDRFDDAPKGFHPCDIYHECKTVIVLGIALPKGLYMVEPRLVYGHFNDTAFPKLDQIAFQTAKLLEEYNGLGVPMPCDSPYEYWDEEQMEGRGLVSMRHAAVNAGLGRLGKSSLLLNTIYGNRLGLGCILTNLSLDSDEMQNSICKDNCRLCIEKCPSQALSGVHTTQKNCRIHTYGTNKRGYGTVDCNQCRTVCPMRFGVSN